MVVVCVCGGGVRGGEAISKLKGAGAMHALPRSYLHVSCLPQPVLYTVSLKQTLRYLSDFKCKFSEKFIRS